MNDSEKNIAYERAKERVKNEKGFYTHLTVFITINIAVSYTHLTLPTILLV